MNVFLHRYILVAMSQLAKVSELIAENMKNARRKSQNICRNLQSFLELRNSQNPADVGGGKGLFSLVPAIIYPKTLDEAKL